MSGIWLPPGARDRYDPAVEQVLDDSPPEARVLADELSAKGVRFVAKEELGRKVTPDDAMVLLADEWGEFDHPKRGKLPIVCITSPELERMVMDATLQVEIGGVATDQGNEAVQSFGPSLYFRLPQFHVYIPLEGAPEWWLLRARRSGFAVAFPEQEDGQRAFFTTEPMSDIDLVLPGSHRGSKAGRNERCPCGSGVKFKRCCGF